MSTPAPSSPSLHPTRRQLDELDALMDRMLELPVDSTGDPSADASTLANFAPADFESYRTDDSDSMVVDSPSPLDFNTSSTVASGPSPLSDKELDRTPFVFHSPAAPTFPGMPAYGESVRPTPGSEGEEPPGPIWLWPVVGINRLYAGTMSRLGAPGRLLLGTGRTWLGWIGLIMIAGALAWGIIDWIHWAG